MHGDFHYLDLLDCGLYRAASADDDLASDPDSVLDAVRMTVLRNVLLDTVTVVPSQWACTSYAFLAAAPECLKSLESVWVSLLEDKKASGRRPTPFLISCPDPERGWLADAAMRYENPETPLFGMTGGDPRDSETTRATRTKLGKALAATIDPSGSLPSSGERLARLEDVLEDPVMAYTMLECFRLTAVKTSLPFDNSQYSPSFFGLVAEVERLVREDTRIRSQGDALPGTYERFFERLKTRENLTIPDLFTLAREFSPREEASIMNVGRALVGQTLRACTGANQMTFSGRMLSPDTSDFDELLIKRAFRTRSIPVLHSHDSVSATRSRGTGSAKDWRSLWEQVWRFKLGGENKAFIDDTRQARTAASEITRNRHLNRALKRVIEAIPDLSFNAETSIEGNLLLQIALKDQLFGKMVTIGGLGMAAATAASQSDLVPPAIVGATNLVGAASFTLGAAGQLYATRQRREDLKKVVRFG